MLMIVIGPGGIGKLILFNTIPKTFKHHQSGHLLLKTEMSRVAATVIRGTTLQWWGGIAPAGIPNSNDWMDKKSTTKVMHSRCEKILHIPNG